MRLDKIILPPYLTKVSCRRLNFGTRLSLLRNKFLSLKLFNGPLVGEFAVEREGVLDNGATSYNDILDAFRLAVEVLFHRLRRTRLSIHTENQIQNDM